MDLGLEFTQPVDGPEFRDAGLGLRFAQSGRGSGVRDGGLGLEGKG